MNNITDFLFYLRKKNNYTQVDVAYSIGLDQSVYNRKERGLVQFSVNDLVKLAKFYQYENFWQFIKECEEITNGQPVAELHS